MSSARAKAALAAVVALLAGAGIVLPGLGDDESCCAPDPPVTTTTPAAPKQQTEAPERSEEAVAIGNVLVAIDLGNPLPYEEDGQTFQNREGLLPDQPLGYYREYTVETPGSPDRGARRLVIGEQGDTWYTNDHYASFARIDPDDYTR